ncbi:MAG: VanZ family protein [Xenococcus sp. (in: cyanobacteria)]
MAQYHDKKQNLLQFIATKSQTIIVLSSFIILFVTLAPFDFTYPDNFSRDDLRNILTAVSSPGDILVNLALFMPFGWGLTAFFTTKKISLLQNILLTLVVSFCFSSLVEILQIFLLLRRTSPTDVMNNSLSGLLGGVLFLLVRNRLRKIHFYFNQRLFLNIFLITWLVYLTSIGISLISLKDATTLSNWNAQFPLMIGNERTGNRAWSGEISYFYISDRFLSSSIIENFLTNNNSGVKLQDYFLGAYIFDGATSQYSDVLGNLPNLVWQGQPVGSTTKSAITLSNNNWLQTEVTPSQLSKRIQDSSQFTILTKIKNQNQQQSKEARIFSLSQNIYQRNLSLEQSVKDLKLRLRSPLTGDNGRNPELILRNFFDEVSEHQIAIAFNRKQFKIYLDSIDNVYNLKFNSEAALFWSVFYFLGSKTPLYIDESSLYNFLYHGLLFIPFGFLLALILIFLPKNKRLYRLIFFLGIILPFLFIESIIIITHNGIWNWQELIVSMVTISLTSLLFKTLMTLKFKNT